MRSALSAALPILATDNQPAFPSNMCRRLSTCNSSPSTPAEVQGGSSRSPFSLRSHTHRPLNSQASSRAKASGRKVAHLNHNSAPKQVKTALELPSPPEQQECLIQQTLTRWQRRLQMCQAGGRSSRSPLQSEIGLSRMQKGWW